MLFRSTSYRTKAPSAHIWGTGSTMEASEGAGPCTKFGSNTGDVESASALVRSRAGSSTTTGDRAGFSPSTGTAPGPDPRLGQQHPSISRSSHSGAGSTSATPSAPTTDLQPHQLQPQSSLTCPGRQVFLTFLLYIIFGFIFHVFKFKFNDN